MSVVRSCRRITATGRLLCTGRKRDQQAHGQWVQRGRRRFVATSLVRPLCAVMSISGVITSLSIGRCVESGRRMRQPLIHRARCSPRLRDSHPRPSRTSLSSGSLLHTLYVTDRALSRFAVPSSRTCTRQRLAERPRVEARSYRIMRRPSPRRHHPFVVVVRDRALSEGKRLDALAQALALPGVDPVAFFVLRSQDPTPAR